MGVEGFRLDHERAGAPYTLIEGALSADQRALLERAYRFMIQVRHVDERLLTLQRQGRVGFHGTCRGQEAIPVGLGLGLARDDLFFPGLRDNGLLLVRGQPLERYLAQSFATAADPTQGRNMPAHQSDREFGVVSWSSCIGNQIPQAVGAAEALRGTGRVVAVAFGDGAISTGDFHAGLNLAGLWKPPCVFVCENNGWSISVPTHAQTPGVLAEKARAYDIPFARVDGNDVVAVAEAVAFAADAARNGQGPCLLELLTYRMAPHSSADDPTRYRNQAEVNVWAARDPIDRAQRALDQTDDERRVIEQTERSYFDQALNTSENIGLPPFEIQVNDVFGDH